MTRVEMVFLFVGVVTVLAAYKVVTAKLITHAALWMAGAFIGIAGVFLILRAEFVAAVQVLIYAGAITTMVIFAIMLSDVEEIKDVPRGETRWQEFVKRLMSPIFGPLPIVVAGGFAVLMLSLYARIWGADLKAAPQLPETGLPHTTKLIGQELFTRYVVPFEIASIVLLVAMVGAIILTKKEGTEE